MKWPKRKKTRRSCIGARFAVQNLPTVESRSKSRYWCTPKHEYQLATHCQFTLGSTRPVVNCNTMQTTVWGPCCFWPMLDAAFVETSIANCGYRGFSFCFVTLSSRGSPSCKINIGRHLGFHQIISPNAQNSICHPSSKPFCVQIWTLLHYHSAWRRAHATKRVTKAPGCKNSRRHPLKMRAVSNRTITKRGRKNAMSFFCPRFWSLSFLFHYFNVLSLCLFVNKMRNLACCTSAICDFVYHLFCSTCQLIW